MTGCIQKDISYGGKANNGEVSSAMKKPDETPQDSPRLLDRLVNALFSLAWRNHIDEDWRVVKVLGWRTARIKSHRGMVRWMQIVMPWEEH